MDTTDFDRPIATVPSDDGSIDRAIAELDTKISDWVRAMTAAQHAVIARTAVANQQMAAEVAVIAAQAVTVAEPTIAAAPVATSPAAAAQDAASAPGPAEKSGLRLDHLREEGVSKAKNGIRAFGAPEPEAEKPDTSQHDEDEALLATLDPKLAKQIKIKRRLCNGTKSIRELLAEGT